jgi:hypothetical protein
VRFDRAVNGWHCCEPEAAVSWARADDVTLRFKTKLAPDACRGALESVSTPERWTAVARRDREATVRRPSEAEVRLYWERPFVRTLVQNMFCVTIDGSPDGSMLSVTEKRTLVRGWWTIGAFALGFASLTKIGGGGPPWRWLLGIAAVFQLFWIVLCLILSFFLARSDRAWISTFLLKTVAASNQEHQAT